MPYANTPNIREALRKAEYGMYFHAWLTDDTLSTLGAIDIVPTLTDAVALTISLNLLADGLFDAAMKELVRLKLEFAGNVVNAVEYLKRNDTDTDPNSYTALIHTNASAVIAAYNRLQSQYLAWLYGQFKED